MSAIPNLLKVGEIPSNLNMFVETSILDPVVQSDTFVRFNMKRAGFLHSNSKLALSLNKRTVANFGRDGDHTFLPVSVGVGSLISRVRLLSGNTVIQEIDDWGHLHAYNSLFISNENQKEREQFTTGRAINMSFDYDDGVANRSDTKATGVALDPGSEYMDGSVNGAQYDPAVTSWSKELQRYQYLDNEPVWQISLMDLCPFLKKTQLPLFMFEEQIFLEITYSDQKIRAVGNAVAVAAHNAIPANTDNDFAYTINQVETKLIIDYITYPQEIMDSWAKANKNLSFQYVDYELSKFTLDRNSASAGFIRNIGGAGRLVNRVIMGCARDGNATQYVDTLLGAFESRHPELDVAVADYGKTLTSNLRYNSEYLFPIDIKNDALHFNNLLMSEGSPPFITRDMFSGQGLSTSSRKFESRDLNGLGGVKEALFYQSLKLNKNNRIDMKGIELYQTWKNLLNESHTLRIWLEVGKVASLVDGKLRSSYV
tara:strand:- start:5752 stop:7203 length:1452 start_codon:yes stop_codon:yes gene_type:complete